jgi:hypothetical protein
MSFHLIEVRRLEAAGGAVLAKYRRLVAAADAAAHDSPAHRALAQFWKAWEQDPQAVTNAAREEAAASRTA